jgi:hypothetical protein
MMRPRRASVIELPLLLVIMEAVRVRRRPARMVRRGTSRDPKSRSIGYGT